VSERVRTRRELLAGLDVDPGFVDSLERRRVLGPVARRTSGEPLYPEGAREVLERVTALVRAGYEPGDIAVIARKLGKRGPRPRLPRRLPRLFDVESLATVAEVSSERIARWHRLGLLEPGALDAEERPLFFKASAVRARELADLAILGLDEDGSTWAAALAILDSAAQPKPEEVDVEALEVLLGRVAGRCDEAALAVRRMRKRIQRVRRRLARIRKAAPPRLPSRSPANGLRQRLLRSRSRS